MIYTLFSNRNREDLVGERRAEYYDCDRTVVCEPSRERTWPETENE